VHAQALGHSQHNDQTSDSLARGGSTPCLNLKTVADTLFLLDEEKTDSSGYAG